MEINKTIINSQQDNIASAKSLQAREKAASVKTLKQSSAEGEAIDRDNIESEDNVDLSLDKVHKSENQHLIKLGKDSFQSAGSTVSSLVGGAMGVMLSRVLDTIAESCIYELKRNPVVSDKINDLEVDDIISPSEIEKKESVASQKEIFEAFSDKLLQIPDIQSLQPEIVEESIEKAGEYLNINDSAIVDDLSLSLVHPVLPPDITITEGYNQDVQSIDVNNLKWKNVNEYAGSRLGPVTALIDGMNEKDEIIFSNIEVDASVMTMDKPVKLENINLPVSSWSKTVYLATCEDDTKKLILSGFPGKVLMKHFQLLLKTYLKDRKDVPKIKIVGSESQYKRNYSRLNDFFRANKEEIGRIDSVVVGYNEAFKDRWKKLSQKTVKDKYSPWSTDIYELPNKKRVAVLSSNASFHGELLGENLKTLIDNNPEIKEVFLGGSGGSLNIRDIYNVVFPKKIVGESGKEIANILSGSTEDMSHISVISPMQETPEFLTDSIEKGVTTVDMEMGYVADALADTDVKVGIGILVTDFPVERKISEQASLTFQDSAKKYQETGKYANSILEYLESGKPVYEHKIENYFNKSLDEISKDNLEWEINDVGEMTPDEKILFDRFCNLTPNYSFRMTPSRLYRILEDGAILSTAMVSRLKNVKVKPYTPEIEDKMYEAFDYTFGSLSFGKGIDEYGEVNIEIKPEVWKTRSWASYRSGWRALVKTASQTGNNSYDFDNAAPELFRKTMEKFSEWLVVPEDYSQSMSCWAIKQLRKKDPSIMKELLNSSDEELPDLIHKHDLMYLEGKIKGSLNLEDIKQVAIPEKLINGEEKEFIKELVDKLKELKIPVGIS